VSAGEAVSLSQTGRGAAEPEPRPSAGGAEQHPLLRWRRCPQRGRLPQPQPQQQQPKTRGCRGGGPPGGPGPARGRASPRGGAQDDSEASSRWAVRGGRRGASPKCIEGASPPPIACTPPPRPCICPNAHRRRVTRAARARARAGGGQGAGRGGGARAGIADACGPGGCRGGGKGGVGQGVSRAAAARRCSAAPLLQLCCTFVAPCCVYLMHTDAHARARVARMLAQAEHSRPPAAARAGERAAAAPASGWQRRRRGSRKWPGTREAPSRQSRVGVAIAHRLNAPWAGKGGGRGGQNRSWECGEQATRAGARARGGGVRGQ
jgi:hypothetical protein